MVGHDVAMKFRNFHQGCCGYNPTHADGSEWAHVLTLPDGSVVYADTPGEALEELIDGYASSAPVSDETRLAARIRHAQLVAPQAQDALIKAAAARGDLDPRDPDELGLLEVLRADKAHGIHLADEQGRDVAWEGSVPLVLVTTSYAPHGVEAPVTGRVVWLDPSGEERYLASLDAAGVANYWAAAR